MILGEVSGLTDTVKQGGVYRECAGNGVNFGFHSASVSALADVYELGAWAEKHLGIVWDSRERSGRFYSRAVAGSDGCWLRSGHVNSPDWSQVEVKGGRLEQLPVGALVDGLRALDCDWRLTRLDVCWDGSKVSPLWLRRKWMGGKVTTATSKFEWYEGEGRTVYIGKQGGVPWVLCVYDRRGFNRVEFRLYQVMAEAAGMLLGGGEVGDVAGVERLMRGMLADVVTVDGRYWQRLIGGAEPVHVQRRRSGAGGVDANRDYVKRMSKQLAVFVRLQGWDGLHDVVREGARNLSRRELAAYGLDGASLAAYGVQAPEKRPAASLGDDLRGA